MIRDEFIKHWRDDQGHPIEDFNDEREGNGNEGEKDGMWLMGKGWSMEAEEEIRNWGMNRKRRENLIMESFPFRGRPL